MVSIKYGIVAILNNVSLIRLMPQQEFVDCSHSLKNLEKYFCNLTSKKKLVKHIENLPQHSSEKFVNYRYRFKKLRFIDYRYHLEFFEISGYCYFFSTEKFIVPITVSANEILIFKQLVSGTKHQNSFEKSCFRILKNLYHQYS